jgi:hypothetical protein
VGAITTATALILGSGIAAGGAVAGSAMQANAAGNAAESQERAAREALQLQWNMYRQQRSDLAPYMSAGEGAQTTLAALMGTPMAPVEDVQLQTLNGDKILPDGRIRPAGAETIGHATVRPGREDAERARMEAIRRNPPPGYQGDIWNPVTGEINNTGYNVPPRPAGNYGERHAPNSSGYVQLRAPNGQVSSVPADQAEYYVARGATRM